MQMFLSFLIYEKTMERYHVCSLINFVQSEVIWNLIKYA